MSEGRAEQAAAPARVLLVDDRPENLLALEAVLEPLGFELVSVRSGEAALRLLLVEEFAVIVLDVQMPVLDGFETARLIKGRERTRHVPIIFLTALSGGLEHHLQGYAAGAVDYVYKPFEPEILRAKVGVLAELWQRGVVIEHQREELALRLDELDRAHESLARQAIELERSNAALDHFAEVTAHDLVDPLHSSAGFLDLLRTRHGLEGEAALLAERAAAGVERARDLVRELLDFARVSGGEVHVADVDLAGAVSDANRQLAGGRGGDVKLVFDGDLPVVRADRRLLILLLDELLCGLVSPDGQGTTEVRVNAASHAAGWRVDLHNEHLLLSEAQVARLFTVFAGQPGAGLALARRIVERHRGAIGCESAAGRGTTIWFTLPGDEA